MADLASSAAAKWDHAANGDLTPDMVTVKSHKRVAWVCEVADDHRWCAPVSRMSRSLASGCPFCAGKQASSTNNLRDHGRSVLLAEWDYLENKPLRPEHRSAAVLRRWRRASVVSARNVGRSSERSGARATNSEKSADG